MNRLSLKSRDYLHSMYLMYIKVRDLDNNVGLHLLITMHAIVILEC